MTALDELANSLSQKEVTNVIVEPVAKLLMQICDEYRFRQEKPLWRRILRKHQHHYGGTIFGPTLEKAGLIENDNSIHIPNQQHKAY